MLCRVMQIFDGKLKIALDVRARDYKVQKYYAEYPDAINLFTSLWSFNLPLIQGMYDCL